MFGAIALFKADSLTLTDDLTSKDQQEFGCTMITVPGSKPITMGIWPQASKSAQESNERAEKALVSAHACIIALRYHLQDAKMDTSWLPDVPDDPQLALAGLMAKTRARMSDHAAGQKAQTDQWFSRWKELKAQFPDVFPENADLDNILVVYCFNHKRLNLCTLMSEGENLALAGMLPAAGPNERRPGEIVDDV